MALRDLGSREAVLRAIDEFDRLGRDRFLERYGFRYSRDYVVVHDGREYDSKAILGAAHGFEHPDLGPLPNTEFNGGSQTTGKLKQLGFEVRQLSDPTTSGESIGGLLARFLSLYEDARREPFSGSHPAARTLQQAAEALKEQLSDSLGDARVKPSVGQGNWAQVPWIAVLDPRETTTTQHGVYPALLIPDDLRGVYVTLAQGVTQLKKDLGRRAAYTSLASRASQVRPLLSPLAASGFTLDDSVDLGPSPLGRDYAASVIAFKYISAATLETADIASDLATLTDLYATILTDYGVQLEPDGASPGRQVLCVYVGGVARANFEAGGRRGWWGWKSQPTGIEPIRVGDLALFGRDFSGGSPRVASEKWQQGKLKGVVVARIDSPPARTDEAVMPDEISGTAQYPWKFRFTILDDLPGVSLGDRGLISSSVAEALRQSAIVRGDGRLAPVAGSPLLERYLESGAQPSGGPARGPVTPAEVAEVAREFVAEVQKSGMQADAGQVAAFLAAAIAKPFLILTGQSGSGKTQLAKRLGEWCGEAASGAPRYLLVPVRPDWTGPEYLFGYPDALAQPIGGHPVWAVPQTLEFLLRAHSDPGRPHVLVLDEMNLAHVERYFADFLSGIESHEPVLPALEKVDGAWVEKDAGRRLPIPRNLIVIGTVNIDETTYLFSPKVLDRAFTFEFRVSEQDLDPALRRPTAAAPGRDDLLRRVADLLSDDVWHFSNPHPEQDGLVSDMRELHRLLSPAGLDFGHRVLFEALRLGAVAAAAREDDRDSTLDLITMTKLLPKVHGSRQRLETALRAIHDFARGADRPAAEPRLPLTAAKLERMLTVLLEAQFVSFTE